MATNTSKTKNKKQAVSSKSKPAKKAVSKSVPKQKVAKLLNSNNVAIISRLEKFIEKKGITFHTVAVSIGMSKTYFHVIKRQNSAISSDPLIRILKQYPDLSAEWLFRGKGTMFIGEKNDKGVEYRSKMEELIAQISKKHEQCFNSFNDVDGIIKKMRKLQKGIDVD